MRLRPIHALHSVAALAVAVQLAFGAAFLLDYHQTDAAYKALAAHHVRVPARVLHCGQLLTGSRPRTYEHACSVTYSFRGQPYGGVVPFNQPKVFYIDPLNPSDRMSVGYFAGGPTAHTADLVIAFLLFGGATLVAVVHQIHLRRRRRGATSEPPLLPLGHPPGSPSPARQRGPG